MARLCRWPAARNPAKQLHVPRSSRQTRRTPSDFSIRTLFVGGYSRNVVSIALIVDYLGLESFVKTCPVGDVGHVRARTGYWNAERKKRGSARTRSCAHSTRHCGYATVFHPTVISFHGSLRKNVSRRVLGIPETRAGK